MTLHAITAGQQIVKAPEASSQIGKMVASLAEKEVVVAPGTAFIMGLNAWNLNMADLTLFHHLPQRPVHSGHPNPMDKLPRLPADFPGCQRPLR
jgi:hypothetical protein